MVTFCHPPPSHDRFTSLYRPSLQGCFEHIGHAIDSYTWGISWFGFAILMWTLPVMLIAMYFYTTL